MEMFVDIFKQLGTDASIVHQFVIVVVMFFVSKFLFLNHLQNVLDTREDKTVNLEGNAEKQFSEIDKAQKEYTEKISATNKSLKQKTESAKAEIVKKEEAKYKSEENKVNSFLEKTRKEVEAEISEKKEAVLKEAEQLAGNLVDKISKGV